MNALNPCLNLSTIPQQHFCRDVAQYGIGEFTIGMASAPLITMGRHYVVTGTRSFTCKHLFERSLVGANVQTINMQIVVSVFFALDVAFG